MPPTKIVYETVPSAARRLGVTPRTLHRRIAQGELVAYRSGPRIVRLDPADVDALLAPTKTPVQRESLAAETADYIARLVAEAPPLTAEQRSRLAVLLLKAA